MKKHITSPLEDKTPRSFNQPVKSKYKTWCEKQYLCYSILIISIPEKKTSH